MSLLNIGVDLIKKGISFVGENPEVAADLASGLLGVLAAGYMSDGTMDAAEATNAARAELTRLTNEQQLELYRMARGADGNAVLPLYFEDFEKNIAEDVQAIYEKQREDLADNLEFGDNVWSDLGKAYGLGNQYIKDVMSGDKLEDRQGLIDDTYSNIFTGVDARMDDTENVIRDGQDLARGLYSEGVAGVDNRVQGAIDDVDSRVTDTIADVDRRLGLGGELIDEAEGRSYDILDRQEDQNKEASVARRAAINTGLGDRLSQIQLERKRRGLGGSSSFSDSLMSGSTIGARQDAAIGDINDNRALLGEESRINEMYLNPRLGLNQQGVNASTSLNSQGIGATANLRGTGINAFQGMTGDFNRNMMAGSDKLARLYDNKTNTFRDIASAFKQDTLGGWDANNAIQGSMLDAPFVRANQAYDFGMLPSSREYDAINKAQGALGFFNIGSSNPPKVETPQYSTVPDSNQLWGAVLGAGNNAFSNWLDNDNEDEG